MKNHNNPNPSGAFGLFAAFLTLVFIVFMYACGIQYEVLNLKKQMADMSDKMAYQNSEILVLKWSLENKNHEKF